MPIATLHLGQLELTLSLPRAPIGGTTDPEEDWRDCQVRVHIRSFSGAFIWSLMPTELDRLADGLGNLYGHFPKAGAFEFESLEPNLFLACTVGSRGEVRGQFKFVDSVTLEGSVEGDQQMLLEAANALRRLVEEGSGGTAKQIN